MVRGRVVAPLLWLLYRCVDVCEERAVGFTVDAEKLEAHPALLYKRYQPTSNPDVVPWEVEKLLSVDDPLAVEAFHVNPPPSWVGDLAGPGARLARCAWFHTDPLYAVSRWGWKVDAECPEEHLRMVHEQRSRDTSSVDR